MPLRCRPFPLLCCGSPSSESCSQDAQKLLVRSTSSTVTAGRPVLSIGAAPCLNSYLITIIRRPGIDLPFFITLQCLDALTTTAFLHRGIDEGNPLMGWVLSSTYAPWVGLLVTKLIAAVIGFYCYRSGRMTLLRLANVGYSLVVGWNLVAIAAMCVATKLR
jgi:Domain of unknown function (DUF5658)